MPTTRHPEYTSDPNSNPDKDTYHFIPAVPELTVGTLPEQASDEPVVAPKPGETIIPENQKSAVAPTSAETPAPPVPSPEADPAPAVAADQAAAQHVGDGSMADQHAALEEPITTQSMGQDVSGEVQEQPLSEKRAEMAAPHDSEESVVNPTSADAEKPKGLLAKIKGLFGGSQNNKEKIIDTTYHSSEADINANRVTDLEAHRVSGASVVNSADRYKVGTGQLAEEAEKKKNEAA